jgi:hypothetical protein
MVPHVLRREIMLIMVVRSTKWLLNQQNNNFLKIHYVDEKKHRPGTCSRGVHRHIVCLPSSHEYAAKIRCLGQQSLMSDNIVEWTWIGVWIESYFHRPKRTQEHKTLQRKWFRKVEGNWQWRSTTYLMCHVRKKIIQRFQICSQLVKTILQVYIVIIEKDEKKYIMTSWYFVCTSLSLIRIHFISHFVIHTYNKRPKS